MQNLAKFLGVFLIGTGLAFAAEPPAEKPAANAASAEKPAPKEEIVPAGADKSKNDDSGKILIKTKEPNPATPDGAGKK